MVESMCQGGFLSKSVTSAWEFLEELVEKTTQWKTAHDDSLCCRFARDGLYFVFDVSHLESKIAVLENMLEGLSPQMPQLSHTYMIFYSHGKALDHFFTSAISNWTRVSEYDHSQTPE